SFLGALNMRRENILLIDPLIAHEAIRGGGFCPAVTACGNTRARFHTQVFEDFDRAFIQPLIPEIDAFEFVFCPGHARTSCRTVPRQLSAARMACSEINGSTSCSFFGT